LSRFKRPNQQTMSDNKQTCKHEHFSSVCNSCGIDMVALARADERAKVGKYWLEHPNEHDQRIRADQDAKWVERIEGALLHQKDCIFLNIQKEFIKKTLQSLLTNHQENDGK